MPTLAGWWKGDDIALRCAVGLADEADVAEERERREQEKRALVDRLIADGVLPRGTRQPSAADIRRAVHDFLCRTPAALVGLSLDDLVGEEEPVNVPGVGPDAYSSWTRRLRLPLEELRTDPGVRAALGCRRSEAR
jgi:4-alpha-glucanotransferase